MALQLFASALVPTNHARTERNYFGQQRRWRNAANLKVSETLCGRGIAAILAALFRGPSVALSSGDELVRPNDEVVLKDVTRCFRIGLSRQEKGKRDVVSGHRRSVLHSISVRFGSVRPDLNVESKPTERFIGWRNRNRN